MSRYIKDEYKIEIGDDHIGNYYIFNEGTSYYADSYAEKEHGEVMKKYGLLKSRDLKGMMKFFRETLKQEYRVSGLKRPIYERDGFTVTRIPNSTVEKHLVYSLSAEKGEKGYSEKKHSVPHYEGEKTPEGMKEWCSWYCFNKMDDGTYEAELDEAWWWGGGHNDGGTIHRDIPEEWFELPYDEFLENVICLAAAKHYLFTVEDLKESKGLKEFFGFE